MKHKVIFPLAFALLSNACAVAPSPVSSAPYATATDIPAARAALKRSVKDPESVRFSGEMLKPGAVCGLFNAKNSYGAYGGETAYAYVIATGEILVLEHTGNNSDDRASLARFDRACPD